MKITLTDLIEINQNVFEIAQSFRSDMRVPARVYMKKNMLADIQEDLSLQQLINVATLPGIVKYALAMPDIHQGYGFPIGGVAATDINKGGVISPGGIGYDINCGVRLLVSSVSAEEVRAQIEKLADELYRLVPSGVGRGGTMSLSPDDMRKVLVDGAQHMVPLGIGTDDDLEFCEEEGRLPGAQPDLISKEAKERGRDQLGTLGSGNHFLEVQEIEEIFDPHAAGIMGLHKGGVVVMIHCGSRGLGHQTCTDHVKKMMAKLPEWGYQLPDRELVCAPFDSAEGQAYFSAMNAAANFAWANRHTIAHAVRTAWQTVFGAGATVKTVYDISHNIGKRERHTVDGKELDLLLHRKGATRAFGPGRIEIPTAYQEIGQPVLIPGTMGTASYVLVGTAESMNKTFGSSCHGAGRRLSRMKAKKEVHGHELKKELAQAGITIRCDSLRGLTEEAPIAYKDVDSVVNVIHDAQIARKVVRVKPMAVIKGG
jgi:tRNA-splicing ligase RtcB